MIIAPLPTLDTVELPTWFIAITVALTESFSVRLNGDAFKVETYSVHEFACMIVELCSASQSIVS